MKRKILCVFLVLILAGTALPAAVSAAVSLSVRPATAKIDLAEGNTLQLDYQLSSSAYAEKLVWKSGNTAIATVNASGLVTAKKKGTVTIGARIPGVTSWQKCKVTVVDTRSKKVVPTSVKTSKSKANLIVGETLSVTATVKPAAAPQTVTWKSSNAAIATVSADGVITARKAGKCRIRATSTAKAKIFGYLTLTVTNGVVPTKITLTAPNKTISLHETLALTPTLTPANASDKLVWSSSNTAVATVSKSGVVTAKKQGTVTIRASSAAKSSIYGTIKLTVTDPNAVTAISIGSDDFYLDKGQTKTLTAVLTPAGSHADISWKSDNVAVASVTTTGKVTALSAGTAVITATAGGKSDTVAVTVLTDERASALPVHYVSSASAISGNSKKIQAIYASAIDELESCVAKGKLSVSERATRKEFLQRGFVMFDMAWAPKANVTYWSSSTSYLAGRIYIGMPYTQRHRTFNLTKWLSNVTYTKSDGYYHITMPSVEYPGNDCSSFVSMCQFGTNSANSYLDSRTMYVTTQYKTISNGFEKLMPGDVLVKQGHVAMFLYYVTSDRIMVLEQGGSSEPNTIGCHIKTISGTYRPQSYRVRRRMDLPSAG